MGKLLQQLTPRPVRGVSLQHASLPASRPIACTLHLATIGRASLAGTSDRHQSFENLEIRVAERDYDTGHNWVASLTSHSLGLRPHLSAYESQITMLLAYGSVFVYVVRAIVGSRPFESTSIHALWRAWAFGFHLP